MSATSALIRKTGYHGAGAWRIVRDQSLFKWGFVLAFALLCEFGLWRTFLYGFRFLDAFGGVGVMIIGRMFSLFFLGLAVMLVLSGLVTSYSTIFRSREIPFLLTRPFSTDQIIVYKALESAGLSSWAFFFVIVPFVGAYAWHENISVFFGLWTFVLSIPFLVICSGIGTLAVLLFVRWIPRGRVLRLLGVVGATAAVGAAWYLARQGRPLAVDGQFSLVRLIPGLRLASNALLPSWWISEGIMSLSRGHWARGLLFAATLTSSAVVVLMAVQWVGARTFYESWQRVQSSLGGGARRAELFGRLDRALAFLPDDIRAMLMKDVRTFLRDPMQWSQALIFFGLLAMYFANLRSFEYNLLPGHWQNTIVFLNVFSVSAVMCSLGARFIYPQLSLEGQGFWFLGLSPTTMRRIVLTKFIASALGMLLVGTALVLLSSAMMQAGPAVRLAACALMAAVALSVCALSTGLGAIFLDLRQQNPAAIVSGFGGTLNLVFSLTFMIGAILPVAMLFHLRNVKGLPDTPYHAGLWLAAAWITAATLLATLLPLALGIRSLRRRDY